MYLGINALSLEDLVRFLFFGIHVALYIALYLVALFFNIGVDRWVTCEHIKQKTVHRISEVVILVVLTISIL